MFQPSLPDIFISFLEMLHETVDAVDQDDGDMELENSNLSSQRGEGAPRTVVMFQVSGRILHSRM